jgi:acetyl esterase/lipase
LLISAALAFQMTTSSHVLADEAPMARGPHEVTESLDLHYVDDNETRHLLDVFHPSDVKNAPVVLCVHAGAWMIGDKNFHGLHRNIGTFLASHGYMAIEINYALSPQFKHPEHVRDLARAYAWVRAHAGDYGGDRDQIILLGHSAGGHMVSLLATDDQYLRDPALKLTDADRAALKAVISVSGVYEIPGPDDVLKLSEAMLNQVLAQRNIAPVSLKAPDWLRQSAVMNPFNQVFGSDAAKLRDASPLTHVRKGLPPFLLLYAENDLPLLPGQADAFAKALKAAGDSVQLDRIADSNHDSILFRIPRPEDPTAKVVLAFLKGVDERTARK